MLETNNEVKNKKYLLFRDHDIKILNQEESLSPLVETGAWTIYSGGSRIQVLDLLDDFILGKKNILLSNSNLQESTKIAAELEKIYGKEMQLIAFSTSGSSGKSKIVVHQLETLLNASNKFIEHYPDIQGKKTYAAFPSNYMAGILNNLFVPLLANTSIVLDRQFDRLTPYRIGEILNQNRIEWLWLSPGMIKSTLNTKRKIERQTRLSKIFNATGPLNSSLRIEASSFFSCPVLNTYGLTELMFVSGETAMSEEVTIGESMKGVSLNLTEKQNIEIVTDTLPSAIFEIDFFDNLSNSKILNNNHKFVTSDLAVEYKKGLYQITSRSDGIRVINGMNVSLNAIENCVIEIENITAAFSGIRKKNDKEELILIMECQDHEKPEDHFVREKIASELPAGHIPNVIEFESLPRLYSGKIDRVNCERIFL